MVTLLIGIILWIGLTLYGIVLANIHKHSLSVMTGMMVSMGLAMMSSLLIGTILGVILEQMLISTEAAILLGMMVGYFTGKPVHRLAALDGLLAGVMGGMMGAMLGVMIVPEAPAITLSVVIFAFVLAMGLITQLMVQEVKKTKENWQPKIGPKMIYWGITLVVGLLIISFPLNSLWLNNSPIPEETVQHHHHH